ncbi:hypothetical protein Tco_0125091, partial [Tanacetum coccineum]
LPEKLGDPGRFLILSKFPRMDECLALADIAKDVIVKGSTSRALIDVYEGELTLRVDNEAITYNLDQPSRYLVNYNDMTANQIDVVELACEEYSQEVLGFSDVIASGNPTPGYDPVCNTPKNGSQRNVFPGALFHNTIAQVMRERPLTMSFEKKSWIV